jgi:hypothetical protein
VFVVAKVDGAAFGNKEKLETQMMNTCLAMVVVDMSVDGEI